LRRLVQKRTLRWSEGVCIIEGPDLVRSAIETGQEFEALYVDSESAAAVSDIVNLATQHGIRVFHLAPGVLEKVADSQSPQPVMGAVRFTPRAVSDLQARGTVVLIHHGRDPGNVGTIIRTASAFGATGVILTGQCVDPYNPKTLRATAGMIFHIPVVVNDSLPDVLEWFQAGGGATYATVVRDGTPVSRLPLGGDALLVMGNESEGLSDDDAALCHERLTIPMPGGTESLNVSVAAGLVLYEAMNQRAAQNVAGHAVG
jgi:TrmH family RNA methyltransferase